MELRLPCTNPSKSSHYQSFEDRTPVDEIYGCPIFILSYRDVSTWQRTRIVPSGMAAGHNAPFGQLVMMWWIVWSGMSTNNFLTYSLEDADAARSYDSLRSPCRWGHRKRFFLSHCGVPSGHWLGPMDETRHHTGMLRYGGKNIWSRFCQKMFHQYKNSHEKDKTVSHIYNRNLRTRKDGLYIEMDPWTFLSSDVWENWVKLL